MKEPTRLKSVLIDPGHSGEREGALSGDGNLGEHTVNLYQADLLASLLKGHALTHITDPLKDDLRAIGAMAGSFDAFISLHCNSFDGRRNYTTVCIDPRYNKPTDSNVKLASKIATTMATNLGIKAYAGPVWPVGVMPNNLMVLAAAHSAGCKIAMLSEAFFIDYYYDEQKIKHSANLAMIGLSQILIRELKKC